MADEPAEGRADDPAESRDRPDDPGDDDERTADPAPLGDLADRIRRRRAEGDEGQAVAPDSAAGDERDLGPFVREDAFDPSASDRLWGSLDEGPPTAAVEGGEATIDAGKPDEGAGEVTVEAGDGVDEHVVPKRSYCESCEYFGDPPAVHCEHPGTTILEFVDADHVRVRRCPVVAERRASGQSDREAGSRPGPFDRG